jgi:hypothetical protein
VKLDVRTLVILAIFVAWIPTMIAALVWLTRRKYPGVGRWSVANVMVTLCLILLSLRGLAPDWLSIVIANAVALAASILFLQGIRLFFGLRVYWWPEFLAGAIAVAGSTFFRYAHDNINVRILIWSLTLGGFGVLCAITLLKRIPTESRFGTAFTGIIFAVAAIANILRAIYVYAFAPVADLFAPSGANAILFAGAGLMVVGWSFGFILMTNERMIHDSVRRALGSPDDLARALVFETPVSEVEVREQVQRIVQSDVFRRSSRMAQFLTLAVDRTLAGRSGDLKEYALGRDVFNRGDDFDPRLDSIVRVEAQRLRRKLDEYYGLCGKGDNVIVQFRAGSYVPFFTYKRIPSENQHRSATSNG